VTAGQELQRLHIAGNQLEQAGEILFRQAGVTLPQAVHRHLAQGCGTCLDPTIHRLIYRHALLLPHGKTAGLVAAGMGIIDAFGEAVRMAMPAS
jgi:hypothetical protein